MTPSPTHDSEDWLTKLLWTLNPEQVDATVEDVKQQIEAHYLKPEDVEAIVGSIFIDIPTGHQITRLAGHHHPECSSKEGFMCDCSILKAAQYAVDKAKERAEANLSKLNREEEKDA